MDFKYEVKKTIDTHNMLDDGDRVIVAFSGGADSTALLRFLHEIRASYGLTIYAVHINHMLRGKEADDDAAFCAKLCEKLGIKFLLYNEDITKYATERGLTFEEAGREKRYEIFEKAARELDASKIAIAHNKNDNAETVFQRILRGAGNKGLTGIPPVRGKIVRPFINRTRTEIETYLAQINQDYKTDSTNISNDYTRNKIRNEIFPFLERELHIEIVSALSRLSEACRPDEEYLENISKQACETCLTENGIDSAELLKLDSALRMRVIRMAFQKYCGRVKDFSMEHAKEILNLACKQTGSRVSLPYGFTAQKNYNLITISRPRPRNEFSYDINFGEEVYINELGFYICIAFSEEKNGSVTDIKPFDRAKVSGNLQIRSRKNGDKWASKKLKDFFIDIKLDRQKRDEAVLLCMGNEALLIILPCATGPRLIENRKFLANQDTKEKFFVHMGENHES